MIDGVYRVCADGVILECYRNAVPQGLLHAPVEAGCLVSVLVPETLVQVLSQTLHRVVETNRLETLTYNQMHSTGLQPMELQLVPLDARQVLVIVRRVLNAELQKLRASTSQLQAVIEHSLDAILIVDRWGMIIFANPAAEQLFERSRQKLCGSDLGVPLVAGKIAELEILAGNATIKVGEMSVAQTHWDEQSVYIISLRDITDRKRVEKELAHNAFHDPLTDLPNRLFFMKQLRSILDAQRDYPQALAALLFLDLDRFKRVNDSMGHAVGDWLLIRVGDRIRSALHPQDTLARLGGDEFGVLLRDVEDVATVMLAADRIQATLSKPFQVQGREFTIAASIGIAFTCNHATQQCYADPVELLRDADLALYHAKNQGRGRSEVFDASLYEAARVQFETEVALKQAIEQQEFVLHYQPIFDLSTQQTLRFEALVRWQHPTRGLVMPGEFIAIAEENGAIVPLGTLILKLACRQIQQWREAGKIPLDVGVSVNTAGLQFVHSQLDQEVAIALAESGLPPENLHIEVTESAIAAHTETVFSTLERIRAQGVSIALDDFGTGHSSLARLQSLPIDCLKVDRAFIARMHQSDRDREFVRAILNFAHSLGLFTVAEGIETLKQRNDLLTMGCPWGQGFWFSRPLADPTQLWAKVAPSPVAYSSPTSIARSQPLRDHGILGT